MSDSALLGSPDAAWDRCDPELLVCWPIVEATGATYRPTDEDVGHRLRVTLSSPGDALPAASETTVTRGVVLRPDQWFVDGSECGFGPLCESEAGVELASVPQLGCDTATTSCKSAALVMNAMAGCRELGICAPEIFPPMDCSGQGRQLCDAINLTSQLVEDCSREPADCQQPTLICEVEACDQVRALVATLKECSANAANCELPESKPCDTTSPDPCAAANALVEQARSCLVDDTPGTCVTRDLPQCAGVPSEACAAAAHVIATINSCASESAACASGAIDLAGYAAGELARCAGAAIECNAIGTVDAIMGTCALEERLCEGPLEFESGEETIVYVPPDDEDRQAMIEEGEADAPILTSVFESLPAVVTIPRGSDHIFLVDDQQVLVVNEEPEPPVDSAPENGEAGGSCELQGSDDRIRYLGTRVQERNLAHLGQRSWTFVDWKWNRYRFKENSDGSKRRPVKRFMMCGGGTADPDPDHNDKPLTRLRWLVGGISVVPQIRCDNHPLDSAHSDSECDNPSKRFRIDGAWGSKVDGPTVRTSLEFGFSGFLKVLSLGFARTQSTSQQKVVEEWTGSQGVYDSRLASGAMKTNERNLVVGLWRYTYSDLGPVRPRGQTVAGVYELRQSALNPKLLHASRYRACFYPDGEKVCKAR